MSLLNLEKGQAVNLTKDAPGLVKIKVGCAWNVRTNPGEQFDLDVAAIGVGTDGKAIAPSHFVFFNSPKNAAGRPANGNSSIVHSGDNRTGAGEGDDETIDIELANVPADVTAIDVVIFIYKGVEKNQNFGQVSGASVRVLDAANPTGAPLGKYDLTEDYSTSTAVVAARVYRHEGEWKFKAVGEGSKKTLEELVSGYGL